MLDLFLNKISLFFIDNKIYVVCTIYKFYNMSYKILAMCNDNVVSSNKKLLATKQAVKNCIIVGNYDPLLW